MNKNSDKLYELIFFVTSRCNSNCSHCFNRNNLNSNIKDLTLKEIDSLSKNLPEIENLLLSGGEPFLRGDLVELINIFRANNNIKTISIPTNGMLTEKIVKTCSMILEIKGLKGISINLSLDGLAQTHDRIRGVSGNFLKTISTLKELNKLRNSHKRLNVLINTVVSQDNYKEIFNLFDYLAEESAASNHFFEVIRPAIKLIGKNERHDFSLDKLFYKRILSIQYRLFKNQLETRNFIKKFLHEISFLGKFALIYNIQLLNFNSNKAWPFSCRAGNNILVLNSDGKIRPCELRDRTFSLKENFKNKKLIHNSELEKEIKLIKKQKCFCTHVCFIDASINKSLFAKYFLIPFLGLINYIKYEYFCYHTNI